MQVEGRIGVLDNPVWHSLVGPRRSLGEVRTYAARFDAEVSPFAAVCDDPGAEAWDELAAIIGPGRKTVLFRSSLPMPAGWSVAGTIPCVQMVARPALEAEDGEFETLGADDVPEMLDLIARTQPGPFGTRTIEFGGYIGVREAGKLVAMAGERLRCGGFTEVSAVCTDEEHRGKGLASALTRTLVHRIRERGEEAFLHASASNVTAIRLYEALGFDVRCSPDAFVVESPSGEG